MSEHPNRRDFLKTVGTVGATGIAAAVGAESPADAQAAAAQANAVGRVLSDPAPSHAYTFLTAPEAAFIEAAVDRLIPADDLTPGGTDCGVATFIDRQLAGAWGSGDRMYMQGPWDKGVPTQGYQSPLTPAEYFRAGIAATNAYCRKTFGKTFDHLDAKQREEVLVGLSGAKITFEGGLPVRTFWGTVYQTVMEGMFSDPIYGGNRDKAGWKLIGFPGAIAVHRENVEKYRDKPFPNNPVGIADMS